ncbi:aldehyde dehydrogenase family protein [Mycetocola tolaasinivorans]|uniref:Aldehyde dehydrogenase family protein n=1 Tax=Mycetocola tolaasinivorans TaxID=76635 RepID=A0A3L7A5T9_9MICO|nr:aldehyde dehydrogenase family protein [Mycetocola tolaasinivorans]RLP75597.1 aldehyde dehydrogenase family protein [Mycetocola tolaasinivorans]
MSARRDQLLFLDGEWVAGASSRPVLDRWNGTEIGSVAIAGAGQAGAAVDAAARALDTPLPVPERAAILARTAAGIAARAEEFATLITAETGKPITAARGEVGRAVETLGWAAEEARRLPTETVALDATAAGAGTMAFTLAEPRGIVAAITPFNFPLNLVLHKVAPALAAGCAVVLKPSDKAVLVAGALIEVLTEAGLPAGRVNLVTGSAGTIVDEWIADDRVAVITFTGSSRVGWELKARSPRKLHVLELGSNTAMVVGASADVPRAAADAVTAALSNSGQACVSLQRLYVVRERYDQLVAELQTRFAAAPVGDPYREETLVGPMITPAATDGLHESITRAVTEGARVLVGGEVRAGVLTPTLLADAPDSAAIVCEEAFGPVLSVIAVTDVAEGISRVNASEYGLNTALYTADLAEAMHYARTAEAGSVLINMPPSFRADQMPYGGVKGSGQGTEGVKYAIHELVQHKLVVFKP